MTLTSIYHYYSVLASSLFRSSLDNGLLAPGLEYKYQGASMKFRPSKELILCPFTRVHQDIIALSICVMVEYTVFELHCTHQGNSIISSVGVWLGYVVDAYMCWKLRGILCSQIILCS